MSGLGDAMQSDLLNSFDRFGEAFQQDPFPFYDAMRAASPAWFHAPSNMYFITSYEHVNAVVKNPTVFSSEYGVSANEPPQPHIAEQIAEIKKKGWVRPATLMTVDPPNHARYRATVAKAFNARVIAALRPALEVIVEEALDALDYSQPVDVKHLFSEPVPVKVIIKALNMPIEDAANVKRWSDDTTAGIGSRLSDERAIEAAHGVVELQQFMHDEIQKRIANPTDDVISMLVKADLPLPEPDADGNTTRKLTLEEAMGILQALVGAGNETTTKSFSAMLVDLATHPAEWEALKANPDRAAMVVEESLRLSTPSQGLFRVAKVDAEVGGVPIPAGSKIFLAYTAANRDPLKFPEPNAFIPDRENVRDHMAFGGGVHFCIGAPLSRLESVIALEKIVERWNTIEVTNAQGDPAEWPLRYEPSFVLRGLESLHLRITC